MRKSPSTITPLVESFNDLRSAGITSLKKLQTLFFLEQPRTSIEIQQALGVDRSSVYKILEAHDDLVCQLLVDEGGIIAPRDGAGRPTFSAFVLTPVGKKLIKKFRESAANSAFK